jgi:hypothetical protein
MAQKRRATPTYGPGGDANSIPVCSPGSPQAKARAKFRPQTGKCEKLQWPQSRVHFSRTVAWYKKMIISPDKPHKVLGRIWNKFLGAKSTSIRDCVGLSVGHPRCAITWKNNSYVAIDSRRGGGRGNWLRRDSITARPSHLGIRRSPCF